MVRTQSFPKEELLFASFGVLIVNDRGKEEAPAAPAAGGWSGRHFFGKE
jgi:hypothetical protein